MKVYSWHLKIASLFVVRVKPALPCSVQLYRIQVIHVIQSGREHCILVISLGDEIRPNSIMISNRQRKQVESTKGNKNPVTETVISVTPEIDNYLTRATWSAVSFISYERPMQVAPEPRCEPSLLSSLFFFSMYILVFDSYV